LPTARARFLPIPAAAAFFVARFFVARFFTAFFLAGAAARAATPVVASSSPNAGSALLRRLGACAR
jgi:hypothetical protein